MNNENITKALQAFITGFRPFVVSILQKYHPGEPWEGLFFKVLTPDKRSDYNKGIREGRQPIQLIDYQNITLWASFYKKDLIQEFGGLERESAKFYSNLQTIRNARNAVMHFVELDEAECLQLFSSMELAAKQMQMPELRKEIERVRKLALEAPEAPAEPSGPEPEAPKAAPQAVQEELEMPGVTDEKALTPWFLNCVPHYDIREGTLDESVFAANLGDVVDEYGESVYSDPTAFFPKTYLTEGLKDLAGRVVRALNGEASENRVISLQTGFGGGKTHSLIAVYHMAKLGKRLQGLPSCAGLLPKGVSPKFEGAKVAVFTNNTTDVAQGRKVSENITIYTLWGELAYQLGGEAAYETMRKNDEGRQAPSASLLKPILEAAAPALILIDELADYCNKAAAQTVGSSTLFNQTTSFMQTLTEVVSRVPKTVLLVTLPASSTEVTSSKIGQEILSSLEARITRIGASVKPVDDDEVFEVVRRRLFEKIKDMSLVKRVAERYRRLYGRLKGELPDHAAKEAYRDRIVKAYPFHPELIDILRNRWGNDAKFQRTRGVLQILASIVNDLWHRKNALHDPQMLILTTDIELQNNHSVTGKITSLMGSNWASVMSADVYGSSSTAHKIDSTEPRGSDIGKFELSKGVATTVLLASVGGLRGFGMAQLKLCVVRPNAFNHNAVNGALDKLKTKANYLHSSSGSNPEFWFDAKPNLNILMARAGAEVRLEELNNEILKRLNRGVQGSSLNVLVNPTADIPEQQNLTAVILHPRFTGSASGLASDTLNEVQTLALKRGNSDRTHRNTLFFLVCSEGEALTELRGAIRAMLACDRLLDEYRGRLEPDQQKEVNAKRSEAEKEIDSALMRAYSLVVKVMAKTSQAPSVYQVSGTKATFASYLVGPVLDALKENDALVARIGRSVLDDNGLFPMPEKPVSVKELYEAFLRFDDKPMITGEQAIADTVNLYCERGAFNVAFGAPGNFTQIYERSAVPGLDVASEDYWLVDKAVTMPKSNPKPDGEDDTPQPPPQPEPTPGPKRYSKIKVSGSVPFENWTDLYRSFLVPLRENMLRVKIEFIAFSTQANELTENSPTLASVKESARQLGLTFEAEE